MRLEAFPYGDLDGPLDNSSNSEDDEEGGGGEEGKATKKKRKKSKKGENGEGGGDEEEDDEEDEEIMKKPKKFKTTKPLRPAFVPLPGVDLEQVEYFIGTHKEIDKIEARSKNGRRVYFYKFPSRVLVKPSLEGDGGEEGGGGGGEGNETKKKKKKKKKNDEKEVIAEKGGEETGDQDKKPLDITSPSSDLLNIATALGNPEESRKRKTTADNGEQEKEGEERENGEDQENDGKEAEGGGEEEEGDENPNKKRKIGVETPTTPAVSSNNDLAKANTNNKPVVVEEGGGGGGGGGERKKNTNQTISQYYVQGFINHFPKKTFKELLTNIGGTENDGVYLLTRMLYNIDEKNFLKGLNDTLKIKNFMEFVEKRGKIIPPKPLQITEITQTESAYFNYMNNNNNSQTSSSSRQSTTTALSQSNPITYQPQFLQQQFLVAQNQINGLSQRQPQSQSQQYTQQLHQRQQQNQSTSTSSSSQRPKT